MIKKFLPFFILSMVLFIGCATIARNESSIEETCNLFEVDNIAEISEEKLFSLRDESKLIDCYESYAKFLDNEELKYYDHFSFIDMGLDYPVMCIGVDDSGNKHNLKTHKSFKPKKDKIYKILINKGNINKGYYIGHKYFLWMTILFFIFKIIGIIFVKSCLT